MADRPRRLDFLDFGRSGRSESTAEREGIAPSGEEPATSWERPWSRSAETTDIGAEYRDLDTSPWTGHEAVLPEFARWLDGEESIGPAGPTLVVRRSYPPDHCHGRQPLARAREVSGRQLGEIGRSATLGNLDITRLAFVDCETTGLAGGTGTCAFLVGIAWLDGDSVLAEQYFLPDFPAERAFVSAIGRAIDRFEGLVSFNGKAFDMPLLETRFALSREPSDCLALPHLDLLHPSRRVWKHRLESCSLGSLEQNVLGYYRDDDVPGWMIPQMYFDYLRSGNVRSLAPVFEHNRLDLMAMVALVGRFGQLLAGALVPDDGTDLYGLGTLFEDLGERDRALCAYESAISVGLPPDLRSRALVRTAVVHRREGRRDLATDTWRRLVESRGDTAARALVELAKHYEHEERDYDTAADLTRQASLLVGLKPWLASGAMAPDLLARRLSRLERRLSGPRSERAPRSSGGRRASAQPDVLALGP